MKNKHELLAPAGNYEKAIIALNYGADAIYIGPKAYSLRARASNFDIEEITSITNYAHENNKKVYVVLNIICRNSHVPGFANYFKKISECKVDGIICADPFIIKTINEIDPNMPIHISTQQSISNSKSALFWK
ncbi:MAG: peptidase U32 family protein, partial [Mycoplasmoidaceae bacterium]